MALADIDAAATRRRIQDIADDAKKAFEAHAQRSADIDAAAQEAAAKEKADLEAALQRKADAEAARPAAEQPEPEDKPRPKQKTTLSLGGEEFQQARETKRAETADQAQPEPKPEPRPEEEPATEESRPNRTLKLGARDDEDAPKQDKPVRKRPPRPEADDDMSGRTWLR
jgi:hypothetical protein